MNGVAAVFLGDETLFLQLALDANEIRAGQIDFVDRDHDLHLGGAGMVDGLDRRRHDAVVCRHHEDDDVGDVRTARSAWPVKASWPGVSRKVMVWSRRASPCKRRCAG